MQDVTISRGFTLVELLLVIAIIGLLVSLSVPAIQASREAARATQCTNNLRQFGVAFANFEGQNKAFPSGVTLRMIGPLKTDPGLHMYGFMADLLPFLEEKAVASRYHYDALYCEPENAEAVKTVLNVAICPSAPRMERTAVTKVVPSQLVSEGTREQLKEMYEKLDKKYSTSFEGGVCDYTVTTGTSKRMTQAAGYQGVERLRSMFPAPIADIGLLDFAAKIGPILNGPGKVEFSVRFRAAEVTDGLSKTFTLTESAGRPHHYQFGQRYQADEPLPSAWADPYVAMDISGVKVGETRCALQCDNDNEIYSFHPNGVNFVFADGHVQVLSADTEPRLVIALMTPNKGDSTEGFEKSD